MRLPDLSLAWIGIVPAALALLCFFLLRKRPRAMAARGIWRSVAQELGLRWSEGADWVSDMIAGNRGGIGIRVDYSGGGRGSWLPRLRTRVRAVPIPGSRLRIPPDLVLGPETLFRVIPRVSDLGEAQIGDVEFDDVVRVDGSRETALAALTANARRIVATHCAQGSPVVEGGEVSIEANGIVRDRDQLLRMIADAGRLALEMSMKRGEVPSRLFTRAVEDPDASVRARSLWALVEIDPSLPECRGAARRALLDSDALVRLAGADALGAEGIRALRELALDGGVDAETRAAALRSLGERADRAVCLATVGELLAATPPAEVLRSAASLIGEHAMREVQEPLLRLAEAPDPETAAAAISALGEIGDSSLEPALLRTLQRTEARLLVAAATALGRIGSAAAVEPLLALEAGARREAAVGRAARRAVESIHARLGDADAGRLSVAGAADGEGGLSVDAPSQGRLSLPIAPQEVRNPKRPGPAGDGRTRTGVS